MRAYVDRALLEHNGVLDQLKEFVNKELVRLTVGNDRSRRLYLQGLTYHEDFRSFRNAGDIEVCLMDRRDERQATKQVRVVKRLDWGYASIRSSASVRGARSDCSARG
jgi:hypothetical protein